MYLCHIRTEVKLQVKTGTIHKRQSSYVLIKIAFGSGQAFLMYKGAQINPDSNEIVFVFYYYYVQVVQKLIRSLGM